MGNVCPNDGWLFWGSGPLQLTGRDNYMAWDTTLDLTAEQAAAFVRKLTGRVAAAVWFWLVNGLLG